MASIRSWRELRAATTINIADLRSWDSLELPFDICNRTTRYRYRRTMAIITSGQSNLKKRPHRRRTRTVQWYHQVALICTPQNTCLLGPTRIQNPNGILIGSAIFAQLMAECCRTCPDMSISPKKSCPLAWGDLNPHLIHGSLGPPESTAQTASRSVQPFFGKLTAESRYTLQWAAPSPLKIAPSHGEIWAPI